MIFVLSTIYFWTKTHWQNLCENIFFEIEWVSNTVKQQTNLYEVKANFNWTWILELPNFSGSKNEYILQNSQVQTKILFEKKFFQNITEKSFFFAFPESGTYSIQSEITFQKCKYITEKTINIFDNSYMYVWNFLDEFNFGILDNIKQHKILLQTFIYQNQEQNKPEDLLYSINSQTIQFQNSKDIFINLKNFWLAFEILGNLKNNEKIKLDEKNIFIVTDSNKNIIKKFLVKQVKQSNINSIFVINENEFKAILFNLSIGKTAYEDSLLKESSMNFDESKKSYRFSYLIDYLVFSWFPLETIKILLSLTIVVLIITFFKQIIWLSSFGVYYPLIFWLSLHTVGTKTTIWLLLIAFLSKMLVNILLKNKVMLITAKISLYVIMYILLTIISLSIYKFVGTNQSEFLIFDNSMIMVVFIGILMTWSKIWNKTIPFLTTLWRKNLLRFLVISLISYLIIKSEYLNQILLIHPGIIFICLIFIFLIWKYLWLQLTEIFRFRPLIQHLKKKSKKQ